MSQAAPSSNSPSQTTYTARLSSKQGNPAVSDDWRGQRVCIKRAYDSSKKKTELLIREAELHKSLIDRHIIQFYDFGDVIVDQERQLGLIMEFAEAGTLQKVTNAGMLLWCDKERIAGEIAHGLSYLHDLGITHCDIKSANVLLTKKFEVKLCDFGSALTTEDKTLWMRGTDGWIAPEALKDHGSYSHASDIYSLGVVMWEMASSKTPTLETNVLEEKLENVPHEYLRTMEACCNEDPKLRPGAKEVALLKQGRSLKEFQASMEYLFRNHENLQHRNLRKLSQMFGGTERDEDTSDSIPSSDSRPFDLEDQHAYEAGVSINVQLAIQYYVSQQFDQAFNCAIQAPLEPKACYLLSQMYRKGDGVDMNTGEAFRWEFRAASSLSSSALSVSQFFLGDQYERVGNYLEALRWFRKAAEQGRLEAELRLGLLYYNGRPGFPVKSTEGQYRYMKYDSLHPGSLANPSEGEKWILRAANQGHISAASNMGMIYFYQEKYSEALEYFHKAVGDRVAEYHIGYCYRDGVGGVPQDRVTALEWFKKSAKKGYSTAEWAVADMLYLGEGETKNLDVAVTFLVDAYKHGDQEAANDLAAIFFEENDHTSMDKYRFIAHNAGSLHMDNRIITGGTDSGESDSDRE